MLFFHATKKTSYIFIVNIDCQSLNENDFSTCEKTTLQNLYKEKDFHIDDVLCIWKIFKDFTSNKKSIKNLVKFYVVVFRTNTILT